MSREQTQTDAPTNITDDPDSYAENEGADLDAAELSDWWSPRGCRERSPSNSAPARWQEARKPLRRIARGKFSSCKTQIFLFSLVQISNSTMEGTLAGYSNSGGGTLKINAIRAEFLNAGSRGTRHPKDRTLVGDLSTRVPPGYPGRNFLQ
eukprot:3744996-Rhodomonas_salina.2